MLSLDDTQRDAMIATCLRALPNEGCGLLLGTPDGDVREVIASENVADSAKLYEVDSRALLAAYRRAETDGLEVIGVFHSHTHSEAYPSATDIEQAPDPAWHYVLVSLKDVPAQVRSFSIVGSLVSREEVRYRP